MGLTTSFAPAFILTGGLIAVWIYKTITDYAKLKNFKGPRWTGVSNWPHSLAILHNKCHEWYAEVNNKYGPVARVAPRVLITSDPDIWMRVNNKPGYKRSEWYYSATRIEYRKDNVFSQTDNAKHDQRRKQMAPGYSGRENFQLEGAIDDRIQDFISLIRAKYISSEGQVIPMDMSKKVQYFTLDVISSVGLGSTFGMLQSDRDINHCLSSMEDGLAIANTALAMGFSWITQAPLIGKLFAVSPKHNTGFGKMMATCFQIVDKRAANSADKRSDMLASFMRHGLSGDELRSEALEQILAGSDTTASGIRGALLLIMSNPRVYIKLQREIDDAIKDGVAPKTGEGLISVTQTKQLPYLQAVIRESLRVLPPVANIFSRDVPPDGDIINVDGEEVVIPGGVCIGYSAYGMHHSEKIYGKDAKAFRPERWFESDPDRLATMLKANDLTFGHGKYRCLGKPVAETEIGKLIFELLRNFDMALINPTRPWEVKNYLGLFAISDMWIQVTERAHKAY
ncbi:uncharacterized protein N7469_006227 [Penicillium citrinum]|uniref:Cytochrome P450 monooxygenase ABA1 n=1 Tax=Penicillium citrinum TaxID=5077 RepID=A0A9W9TNX0_PENCI|nr:uncharacterized protein N7469_006227 [Penicillium citrinum]KAJ5231639.1 hypothetical protein N7469_006227 [Penicillium citrinum]